MSAFGRLEELQSARSCRGRSPVIRRCTGGSPERQNLASIFLTGHVPSTSHVSAANTWKLPPNASLENEPTPKGMHWEGKWTVPARPGSEYCFPILPIGSSPASVEPGSYVTFSLSSCWNMTHGWQPSRYIILLPAQGLPGGGGEVGVRVTWAIPGSRTTLPGCQWNLQRALHSGVCFSVVKLLSLIIVERFLLLVLCFFTCLVRVGGLKHWTGKFIHWRSLIGRSITVLYHGPLVLTLFPE